MALVAEAVAVVANMAAAALEAADEGDREDNLVHLERIALFT